VAAVGWVYQSASAFYLKKIVYNGNNYPVSYTLANGTVVNLGSIGVSGAGIAAATNTFVGVIDSSGVGIKSITVRTQGTVGSASQRAYMDDLAFVTLAAPPAPPPSGLAISRDFPVPANIVASSTQLSGLSSLAAFRASNTDKLYVYTFETWPTSTASLGSNSYTFNFDLNGDGPADQQVTVTYNGPYAGTTKLSKATNAGSTFFASPTTALAGLGDIGWGGSTYADHTLAFSQPVSAAGFVYRSSSAFYLKKVAYNANNYPVSYTLTDNTVVNLGASGVSGATIAAGADTFVGVIDSSGKGIKSLTVRVQGSVGSMSQQVNLDDLAFIMVNNPAASGQEGPPPGNWTLSFEDHFTGTALNTSVWSKGYRWAPIINNELQAMRPENVTLANNSLCTIKAEKRPARNMDMTGYQLSTTQNYASGCIQSYNKWTQAYGYFEARIKMSSGKGTWPAFWLLPDRGAGVTNLDRRVEVSLDNGYGIGNEFDITEYQGAWKSSTTGLSKSHSGYFWNYSGSGAWGAYALENGGGYYPLLNPDTSVHNYGMYWCPGSVYFYIDGKMVAKRETQTNIATVPEYLILNLSLTQNAWGMAPDPTLAEIDAGMPNYMYIDYVRVYTGAPSAPQGAAPATAPAAAPTQALAAPAADAATAPDDGY